MNKIVSKIISGILVLTLSLYINVPAIFPIVFASANESTFALENKNEQESKEDAKRPIYTAGDWNKADNNGVVPPYSHFHEDVQKYLIEKYGSNMEMERNVTYKSGYVPEKNKTDQGRIDLRYKQELEDKGEKIYYYWEVKPGSYLRPNLLLDGYNQLNGYVNNTYLESGITENRFGNMRYSDSESFTIKGLFSLSEVFELFKSFNCFKDVSVDIDDYSGLDASFDCIPDSSGKYLILIMYLPDGLILYWFKEIPDKCDPDAITLPDLAPFYYIVGVPFFYYLFYMTGDYGFLPNSVPSLEPEYSRRISEEIKDVEKLVVLLTRYKVTDMYRKTALFIIAMASLQRGKTTPAETNMGIAGTAEALAINLDSVIKEYESSKTPENAELVTNAFSKFYNAGINLDLLLECSGVDPTDEDIEEYDLDGFYDRKTVEDILKMLSDDDVDSDSDSDSSASSSDNSDSNSGSGSSGSEGSTRSGFPDRSDEYWIRYWREYFRGELEEYYSNLEVAEETVYDPLILDLNNNGYEINTKNSGAYFDLNCDGFAEKINWTTADALLAIDKNSNGKIDDGNEVFGDSFILENGEKAKNGFEALSSLDTTDNKLIDSRDEAFNNLLLWIDSNGNGKSEAKELSTLADNKIYSISLEYDEINELTNSEAIIGNESKFTYTNGESSKIGEMWVSSDLYDALETIIAEPTEEIAGLPNVRSIGRLNSLHTAMVRDDTGRLIALVRNFTKEQDREKRLEMVRQILCIMSKSEEIDPASRGAYIDAKHLAVIEAVLGKDFFGTNGSNPNPTAAVLLEEIYNNILNTYYFAMLFSRTYEYIDNISVVENEDETITYDLDSFNAYVTESINNGTMDGSMFTDVSSSLNFISVVTLGDHSLLIEFMDYISANHNDYLPLVYGSVYDAIRGSSDADELYGTDKDDIIISDEGDDFISAGNGNDYILGLEDSDTLYGDNGDDVLDGGNGNDILYGGYGDDSYRFGRNCGKDTINEQGRNSSNDKVVFGEGITTDDIVVSRDGNDMILTLKDSDDSLRIVYQYCDSYYWIESFEFSDGTVLSADDWFDTSLVISGSETIEDYDGGYGTRDTTLIGSESDDAIYGYSGNDILDGDAGNDSLYGGYGNDIYRFGRGYGQDTINEQGRNSSNDKVVFGKGVNVDDIVVSRDGNDMILSLKDTDDSLRIVYQYADSYYWIESFEFSDGTVLTADDWFDTSLVISGCETIEDYDGGYGTRDTTLIGSESDDAIYGYSGNDILDGSAGNDSLYGGYGNDIYKFGIGYGQDTINEQGKNSNSDKVIFGKRIKLDDITVSRDGNDMILTIRNTDDSLRIAYQYYDSYYRIENFEFSDGTVVSADYWYNVSLEITGSGKIEDYDGGYGTRNTSLIGSSDEDLIYGYSGNDVLDGAAGNDVLYGGYDDDTYIFGRNYGQDTINEQGRNSSNDKVVFGKEITVDDIVVSRDGNDMILTIKGTSDSLRITYQYGDSYYRIEWFEFADGTKIESDAFYNTSLTITGSGLIVDYDGGYGVRNTTLIGSASADSIYGYSGDDTLDGGAGDDSLYGGYDDDIYIFGKKYGRDTINEQGRNSSNDKVIFGEGITTDDIVVNRDGNDMILTLKDSDDSLRIVYQYADSYYWIEKFVFSDGSVLTANDLFNTSLVISGSETIEDFDGGYGTRDTTLIGSESDDAIYGYSGNDILDGGAGNDSLYGGYGDDVYRFGRGYGQDTINEQGRNSSSDKVIFGEGITTDDIVVSRDGSDMILTLKDSDDSLRIVYQYADSYYWVECFEFADGSVLTAGDLFNTSLVISGSETIEDYDGGYGTRDTTLIGSESDDAIYGYSGNDILDGGVGNDLLYGGYGDDVYRFGRGCGQDTINEQGRNSGNDKVIFGENISIDDILLTIEGTDIILTIKDTDDSLRIVYQNYDSYYRIELFEFSDGTVAEIDYQQMTLKEAG